MVSSHHDPAGAPKRLLRIKSVQSVTGLSRSTLYNKITLGEFPAPIRIGARAVAWLADDVARWIDERVSAARQASGGK